MRTEHFLVPRASGGAQFDEREAESAIEFRRARGERVDHIARQTTIARACSAPAADGHQ